MKHLPVALAGVALLALAACGGSKVETADSDTGKKVSISIDAKDDDSATASASSTDDEGAVTVDANTDTGKFGLKLPGGIEANVNVPGGMVDKTHFDIDGVGLYPGAKIGTVNVKALTGKGKDNATVKIGFTAPADAAAVADWYQQQFEAKKVAVSRSGETLTGKTDDGDDFTLALTPAGTGTAKGELTIIDAG
jgi:uncharacterized glyoxalase superfamily protein PhnB